ncbi:MAG: hypothetical protein GY742_05350 [Hyphomicrobiales bacterium]|nr:hypothetical protein [Hyphomicrobiales bacterium]
MTPILPKHVYGNGQDIRTHPANLKPVGSGPFKFVSYTDKEIVLEKYTDFFLLGRPRLDKVIFKIMNPLVVPIAYETGAVHLNGSENAAEFIKQVDTLERWRCTPQRFPTTRRFCRPCLH